ncbi:alpha/beta fold hydrolase [Nocardia cyriacigeorgica]|uniref:alpha/beta fold hydrolase n=1 Tax=Nocardia cyriacigeorgica TaxID=135487 RepID=UPI001895D9E8|nr:alpha/beta hydrolase [Nocardia cyriacigeorgica]MBF6088453.1 alpha/beta hydrolase [Nocardia cyriacigeorgica]MBF6095558.1 alpha/beta hydrolase [Nocardia cyriacigeorgica]
MASQPITRLVDTPLTGVLLGNGPGLLLAHGASSDVSDSFGPLLDQLAQTNTVIAPDYPGSGDTPLARQPLTLDGLADQLVHTAVASGHDQVAILGFSTGAPVAVRAATRHPDRVVALILSAGPARPNPRLLLLVDTWRTLARAGDRRALATYLILIGWSAAWLDGLSAAELAELAEDIPPQLPPGADAQLDLLTRVDVTADLAGITIPALVVAGAHDQVISRALTDELAHGIAGAESVVLDSGHALAAERPREWADTVTEFLSRIGHTHQQARMS